jgi:hypothetical protein
VTARYKGDIGTPSSFLVCDCERLNMNGSGTVWVDGTSDAADEINVYQGKVVVLGDSAEHYRVFGGTLDHNTGTMTNIRVMQQRRAAPAVYIERSSTAAAVINVIDGTMHVRGGSIASGSIQSGKIIFEGPPESGTLTGTLTVLGGVVDWQSDTDDAGSRTFNIYAPGKVTVENMGGATSSLSLGDVNIYGGTLNLQTGATNVYVGSETPGSGTLNVKGDEVALFFDPGRKVTIADI